MSAGRLDRCECSCGKLACASVRGRRHGTPSAYRQGCRCDECTSAATQRATDRHRRANDESRERAQKAGQVWTGAEMEIALRDDLTAREAALLLGRSLRAVENRRHLCRTDPKWIAAVGVAS